MKKEDTLKMRGT